MIPNTISKELSQQVNREFKAAYLYLAMSIYADSRNMDGFANWFRVQAQEEITHGVKIYNYLRDLGATVELFAIDKPQVDFKSFQDVLETTLANEKEVASDLNRIAGLALEARDMITYSFLEWFLKEQIEEIALSSSVLEKVKLVGTDGHGLLLINDELKRRKPENEDASE